MRTFVQLAAIALAVMVLGAGSLQARPPMILLNGGGIVQKLSFPPLVGQFLIPNKLVNRSPESCSP